MDRTFPEGLSGEDIPRNIRYAAALFEALAAYNISDVIDPASSFVEMSEDAAALDSLNYPHQTLYYRGGDCDDLSILYCSLLEALGVDTAFVTLPGHIYLAFEPGVVPAQDGLWNAEGLIEQDGKWWMPVEITVPDEGFYQACRIGARQWNTALSRSRAGAEGPRLYPMRESWAVYPSVTVVGDTLPDMPEEAAIVERIGELMARLW
ncbi:MAG: hypothetical protein LBD78_09925 [Spirochaetaceae bacterium]|nr:hypothetical protein [Spirochaetaceae bacterium]